MDANNAVLIMYLDIKMEKLIKLIVSLHTIVTLIVWQLMKTKNVKYVNKDIL